jgi:hypothetical protein
VLDVEPKIVKTEGDTELSVLGYGFADTGKELKCKFGSDEDPLTCSSGDCIVDAKFVSDKEVVCRTPKSSTIKHVNSGRFVSDEWIPVEVTVNGLEYTTNNIRFRYFEEPEYDQITPKQASANGGTYLVTPADFKWDEAGIN